MASSTFVVLPCLGAFWCRCHPDRVRTGCASMAKAAPTASSGRWLWQTKQTGFPAAAAIDQDQIQTDRGLEYWVLLSIEQEQLSQGCWTVYLNTATRASHFPSSTDPPRLYYTLLSASLLSRAPRAAWMCLNWKSGACLAPWKGPGCSGWVRLVLIEAWKAMNEGNSDRSV